MRLKLNMAHTMADFIRADGRSTNQLRPLRFQNHIAPYATGSTLIEWGNTRVICGVTVDDAVPRWMKEQSVTGGWITAASTPAASISASSSSFEKAEVGRSGGKGVPLPQMCTWASTISTA